MVRCKYALTPSHQITFCVNEIGYRNSADPVNSSGIDIRVVVYGETVALISNITGGCFYGLLSTVGKIYHQKVDAIAVLRNR